MKLQTQHNGKLIEINRLKKAKSIRLRYNPTKQIFNLVAPPYIKIKDIETFLNQNNDWIENKCQTEHLTHGSKIELFGTIYHIEYQKDLRKAVEFNQEVMMIFHPHDKHSDLLEEGLKKKSLEFFTEKSLEYAEKLNVVVKQIKVRDMCSRWGSCSSTGNISYAWRLIFAPLEVGEYICAHEVSHCKFMDHSKDFWNTVAIICPSYKQHRAWLKRNGNQLFRHSFR